MSRSADEIREHIWEALGEEGGGEPGPDGGAPLAETPPELAQALDALDSVVGLMASGTPVPAEAHAQLMQLLTATQAKVDLMQTSQVPLLAARLVRVSRLAEKVEQQLESRLVNMSDKSLVSLLTALNAERAGVSRQIKELAQRPAASSADAMASTLADPLRPAAEEQRMLPQDGRRNVLGWVDQFQEKLREVREEEQAAAARRASSRRDAVDGVVGD